MSAHNIACILADAMAPMIEAMTDAMGANTRINWFPKSDRCHAFWAVDIHVHGKCFTGSDESSPSRALMNANADRQAWEEALARTPAPVAPEALPALEVVA